MNEGRGGIRAGNYQSTVMNAAWQTRQNALDANKWIVMLGINDNRVGDSPATFKANLTNLLNTLITSYGATPSSIWLPHPLYDNGSNGTPYSIGLANYPAVIDQVRSELGLQGGADLFSTMQNYLATEYDDNVHPNATGYVRVARILGLSMMQPTVTTTNVVGNMVMLAWESLADVEPTIAGYRIRYGRSANALTSTATTTSPATSIVGLVPSSDYYFAVEAYDNDPYDLSYSDAYFTSALRISAESPTGVGSAPSDNRPDDVLHDDEDDGETQVPNEDDAGDHVILRGGTMGRSPVTGDEEVVTEVSAGDYIRSSTFSTVYYVTADGYRRPFVNELVFFTHETSFAAVRNVTDATLPELPLGPPMVPRVGSVLVKIESDPRVYVLEENPSDEVRPFLRWITTEDVARATYGEHWADYVIDLPPTLFSRFVNGVAVTGVEEALREGATAMVRRAVLLAMAVL